MGSLRVTFRVPRAREDELVAELWALGTTGVHVRSPTGASDDEELLDAYFDEKTRLGKETLGVLGGTCDAVLVEIAEVESGDWLASYRESCEPLTIGPFVIDPREPESGNSGNSGTGAGCRLLRIPARNAFGTGSHESTRLLLEELGELDLAGRAVLDVGTGSGILALAALARGARQAVGFDPDVGSVVTARDNARLNNLKLRLFGGRIEAIAGRFDVVLVNILPHRWIDDADRVVETLLPGGSLFVSGLLARERETLLATPALRGLELRSRREMGEWASLHLLR